MVRKVQLKAAGQAAERLRRLPLVRPYENTGAPTGFDGCTNDYVTLPAAARIAARRGVVDEQQAQFVNGGVIVTASGDKWCRRG